MLFPLQCSFVHSERYLAGADERRLICAQATFFGFASEKSENVSVGISRDFVERSDAERAKIIIENNRLTLLKYSDCSSNCMPTTSRPRSSPSALPLILSYDSCYYDTVIPVLVRTHSFLFISLIDKTRNTTNQPTTRAHKK